MKIFVWIDEPISHEIGSKEVAEIVGKQISEISDSVSRVMVSIRDMNAHKGGRDKICRVTAHLRMGEVITISEQNTQIATAASKAAARMRLALVKALQRKQLYRKRSSFAGKIKPESLSQKDDQPEK